MVIFTDNSAGLNFTDQAWERFYAVAENTDVSGIDAQNVYQALRESARSIPFGDYLKRYIYLKAELSGPYDAVPLSEYQSILKASFLENAVPRSFEETKERLSTLSHNWLTQQSVSRRTVLLLGFGLKMSEEDVAQLFTRGLREQSFNLRDPLELISLFCFRKGFGYPSFERLWEQYRQLAPSEETPEELSPAFGAPELPDTEAELLTRLAALKGSSGESRISQAAYNSYLRLYKQTRECIAELKSSSSGRTWQADEIGPSDLEQVLSSAVPQDRHGNLKASRESSLGQLFAGKRLSRQRIRGILQKKLPVTRFDLITLLFFIWSQKEITGTSPSKRFSDFEADASACLKACGFTDLYAVNPYESFIMMCLLSDNPLECFASVWELSYRSADGDE